MLFSNRPQITSNVVRTRKRRTKRSQASVMFFSYSDVFCDLLLNKSTAAWDLFVLCDKKGKCS